MAAAIAGLVIMAVAVGAVAVALVWAIVALAI